MIRISIFALFDFLLPNHGRLNKLRGSIARVILGLSGAKNLQIERGIDFGRKPKVFRFGSNIRIQGDVLFQTSDELITIGDNTFIARGCRIISFVDSPITLGKYVALAPNVTIFTGSHEIGPSQKRWGLPISHPITIGDGAWICLDSKIMADVGSGAIVNACSLVNKPVPSDVLVQGIPAKVKRDLSLPANAPSIHPDSGVNGAEVARNIQPAANAATFKPEQVPQD